MATLMIRNLTDQTREAIRLAAAKHGRSMEADLRDLVTAYAEDRVEILPTPSVSDQQRREAEVDGRVERAQAKVRKMFGGELPKGRVEAFLAERRAEAERGE